MNGLISRTWNSLGANIAVYRTDSHNFKLNSPFRTGISHHMNHTLNSDSPGSRTVLYTKSLIQKFPQLCHSICTYVTFSLAKYRTEAHFISLDITPKWVFRVWICGVLSRLVCRVNRYFVIKMYTSSEFLFPIARQKPPSVVPIAGVCCKLNEWEDVHWWLHSKDSLPQCQREIDVSAVI